MSIEVWKTETQSAHVRAEILEYSLLFLTLLIVSFIYTVIYMNGKCQLFVPHLPHSYVFLYISGKQSAFLEGFLISECREDPVKELFDPSLRDSTAIPS